MGGQENPPKKGTDLPLFLNMALVSEARPSNGGIIASRCGVKMGFSELFYQVGRFGSFTSLNEIT